MSDNLYVECQLPDSLWFLKAIEFMHKNIGEIGSIPLYFTGDGIRVNMSYIQEKKKNADGYALRAFLYTNQSEIPEYQLYKQISDSEVRCFSSEDCISFGVENSVLSEAFFKSKNTKNTMNIKIISKTSDRNLFYQKSDDSKSEYTLKTTVGFTADSLKPPAVILGNETFEIFDEKKLPPPNFCLTMVQFNSLCEAIKHNEDGDLKISVYNRGARFTSSKYGNSGRDVNTSRGVCSKLLDRFTMDSKFFARMFGQFMGKIAFDHSIIKFYFGRLDTHPVVTLIIPVGYASQLIYQKEVIQ